MDVGPVCGECDVCDPRQARRPRKPRRPRSAMAAGVGRKPAARACPRCGYALRVCHGKFGWFRACSKRGSGCNFTRDLSPAGFAKLPASAREAVGSGQPARTCGNAENEVHRTGPPRAQFQLEVSGSPFLGTNFGTGPQGVFTSSFVSGPDRGSGKLAKRPCSLAHPAHFQWLVTWHTGVGSPEYGVRETGRDDTGLGCVT